MTHRLPIHLRLFWGAFFLVSIVVMAAVPIGPIVEEWLAPVRSRNAKIENVSRGSAYLAFDWVGIKNRTPTSPGVDVTMQADGDQLDLALYNDVSIKGEPRCNRLVPWSRSHLIDTGFHRQPFCIEIPRTVSASDPFTVDVVLRYRGFLGLWEVQTRFPPITSE